MENSRRCVANGILPFALPQAGVVRKGAESQQGCHFLSKLIERRHMGPMKPKRLSSAERDELFHLLEARFEGNRSRHAGMKWDEVRERLEARPEKLRALYEMERSGGEPDVIGRDPATGEVIFTDCSKETPKGRTSVCYDREGLESRKEHKPKDSALDMAEAMGIEMLTETQYRELQTLGEFDTKTSSWIRTPADIRQLGGALFCDRRFGHVFTYHNGAQSYFGARGFRASLRV
jgi:hypothetical protein